jgi:hypothetical protein
MPLPSHLLSQYRLPRLLSPKLPRPPVSRRPGRPPAPKPLPLCGWPLILSVPFGPPPTSPFFFSHSPWQGRRGQRLGCRRWWGPAGVGGTRARAPAVKAVRVWGTVRVPPIPPNTLNQVRREVSHYMHNYTTASQCTAPARPARCGRACAQATQAHILAAHRSCLLCRGTSAARPGASGARRRTAAPRTRRLSASGCGTACCGGSAR